MRMAAPVNAVPELSDRDLAAIVRLVYEKSGITLHSGKRALVTARLQKVLKLGGFGSFKDYLRCVKADTSGGEVTTLLNAIATNHTAFFREPQHFEFLAKVVLAPLYARSDTLPVLGWSAACSSGEEPYTIAMTAFEQYGQDAERRVRLLASDLSTRALGRAQAAVYKAERVAGLPRHLILKYFEQRPPLERATVRVAEPVRRLVEFRRLNLLDPPPPGRPLDFIFCRNAMIYFDRPIQQRVVQHLEQRLAPGGFLFTSHSESLNGLSHGLAWVAPAVYQRGPR
jgi:chemotaxis protein methyltransferase CheR